MRPRITFAETVFEASPAAGVDWNAVHLLLMNSGKIRRLQIKRYPYAVELRVWPVLHTSYESIRTELDKAVDLVLRTQPQEAAA